MEDIPNWEESSPLAASNPNQKTPAPADQSDVPSVEGSTPLEEKYGGVGQQVLSGIEGLGQGVIGPVAPAIERAIGIKPEDIRARAEASPMTHGLLEAAGFIGSSIVPGLGEASLAGRIGNIGEHAAALLPEATSTISKIAQSGIKTGAEMAALQASDEISKAIIQSPGQSLGSAAINIGLSGILGGAGGAVIGSVSPLFKSTLEKSGLPKIIDDAKAQYGFRKSLPNGGDVPSAITDELTTRMGEVDHMREQMSNLKGDSLARAMPEVNPENTEKINSQIQEISNRMTRDIEKASDNAYLKGAVPKLAQDFQEFLEVVTNPESTYADKFDAIDELKRSQQAKSKYNLTAEDTALGAFTKNTARDLRLALEDPKVWGDAADVQRKVNAAIKSSIDAEKDASSKFTSKVLGDRVADPNKVNSLVNQTLKGKAGLKTDIMSNYLENTQNLAETINNIHANAGLEAPVRLTPTPALDHTLGRSSAGTTLGNWLYDKGLASLAGHVGGETIGAGIGSLLGHPVIGAIAGERLLAPAITSIAKPLLESASHGEAFKGALDYAVSVLRGDKIFNSATTNLFKSGAEILPKHLIPDMASREKAEKSLEYASIPQNSVTVGGNLGHYLPDHATSASAAAATAVSYFKALKPIQVQQSPLDKPSPIDRVQQQKYNRALDVAQQPLVVLQHARSGTLQPQDVQTLKTIYPDLHKKMVSQIYSEMIQAKANGSQIPYKQRVSLSLLVGQPLDSTMTQPSIQSIIMANAPKGPLQNANAPGKQRKVSQSTSRTMEKANKLYATPDQSRAASRTAGSS